MKIMIMTFMLLLMCSLSYQATAQDSTARRQEDNMRVDSLAKAYDRQENAKADQQKDSENLSDLKSEKRETKTKAKEAQRVETEANDAARESKIAYRMEKKAQRARTQADKQTNKATKARTKSDKN